MSKERLLAINGGTPVRTTPFPPWPSYADDEIDAVTGVLASGKVNYWTGQEGRLFEQEFAAFTGRQYAVALANGTLALELALYVLDIGPNDEVIVPCRTFIASASCVVMRGAKPVMADIDPVSQNITAGTIRDALSSRTKAIIVVHLAGWPCDMDSILALAREHGIKVIEDCAQAHGATYKGRPVGSFGDLAAFSFCQDKIMTTGGEGGMLVLDDQQLWQKAWAYKDHGKSYNAIYEQPAAIGFNWVHESFGTNWRLTEMQSAIGRVQLRKLPSWVAARHRNASLLSSSLTKLNDLRLTTPPDEVAHAYYKYYLFLRPERLGAEWTRNKIMQAINAEGIPCLTGSCGEIYMEKAFPSDWRPRQRFAAAQKLFQTSLMFLVHPTLSECDIADTATGIEKVIAVATQPDI